MGVKQKKRLSIADLGAMDPDMLREISLDQGYERLACYRIISEEAILIVDTGGPALEPLPSIISCSDYYYTAKSRIGLINGWQLVSGKTTNLSKGIKNAKIYLPVQDLWATNILFLATTKRKTITATDVLDGFLEALARKFHHWMAGDELRHFIDDATNEKHMHSFRSFLAQILSHELRNPVANLMSLCQVQTLELAEHALPQQSVKELVEQVSNYTDEIFTTIQKLELLTAEIPNSSPEQDHAVEVDLIPVIRDLVIKEQKSRNNSLVKVILSLPDSHLKVQSVPSLLKMAIREVVKNAFEFGNNSPIRISAYQSMHSAIIDIEEDGIPVASGHDELIFLRYFQGLKSLNAGTISLNRRGLGLGLYLARFATKLQGGQLFFVRGVGKKGIFRMILPAAITNSVAS